MTLLFTKKKSLQCQRPLFASLFNFVGMLLRHMHRDIFAELHQKGSSSSWRPYYRGINYGDVETKK